MNKVNIQAHTHWKCDGKICTVSLCSCYNMHFISILCSIHLVRCAIAFYCLALCLVLCKQTAWVFWLCFGNSNDERRSDGNGKTKRKQGGNSEKQMQRWGKEKDTLQTTQKQAKQQKQEENWRKSKIQEKNRRKTAKREREKNNSHKYSFTSLCIKVHSFCFSSLLLPTTEPANWTRTKQKIFIDICMVHKMQLIEMRVITKKARTTRYKWYYSCAFASSFLHIFFFSFLFFFLFALGVSVLFYFENIHKYLQTMITYAIRLRREVHIHMYLVVLFFMCFMYHNSCCVCVVEMNDSM